MNASKRTVPGLFLSLLLSCAPMSAQSAACNQAKDIVEEVKRLYASGIPDHAWLLRKLETARNLCPPLGEAWKYSYCSAVALGDEKKARIYKGRAVLNGVSDLSCVAGGPLGQVEISPLPARVRDKFALVIGIGKFRDSGIQPLRFAAKDARDLAAVLTDPRYGRFKPENVTLLTDEKATRANVLNALQEIFEKAQEDDLVFLYVSSHGSPHQDERGLGGVGYIVTYDASLKNLWVDGLEYQGFSEKASLIRARRKVILLDTCYSGIASRSGAKALSIEAAGVDPRTARLFLSGEGTYVVTSSKASERSFESEDLQNSYFTYYLMQALQRQGEAPTIRDIFEVLTREVPKAVAKDKGASQHPQILPAEGKGDVRIGVIPLLGAPPVPRAPSLETTAPQHEGRNE